MARYHINKNGVPAVYHAGKGNCPLGGVTGSENHYNSLEEAQAAVDNMHANDFINSSGDLKGSKELNANSEQMKLEAVKRDGYAIQFIDNPSEQVQLAAVKRIGYALHFIDNPSENVQLAAVKQNGRAIKYIDNPSDKVQLEAAKQIGGDY